MSSKTEVWWILRVLLVATSKELENHKVGFGNLQKTTYLQQYSYSFSVTR
jgi:hypothetical protein